MSNPKYREISLKSYENAKEIMKEIDLELESDLVEYREVLSLYPTAIELKAERGKAFYRIHFFPLDKPAQKMLEEDIDQTLEGKTSLEVFSEFDESRTEVVA